MKRRRRKTLSDMTLLTLLNDGEIQVDLYSCDVWKSGRLLKPTIVGRDGKNCTRYRIEICHFGCKRSIVRSRLVYMAGARILIPKGFEIHHRDEDRYNDSFANLIMLTTQDHLKLHTVEAGECPF